MRESLAAWQLRVPRLRAPGTSSSTPSASRWPTSRRCSMQTGEGGGIGKLPAAGMPWFMTVFGRDTLITSLQTLLFGPELARGALRELAALQATDGRPVASTPSRARSSTRCGAARPRAHWFDRYYGTVDATPLYLDPALGGLAVDGRRGARRRAARTGARRAAVDRRVRRPRRRRVRRVRAADAARAREPVVEGLRRLAALPRRTHRGAADRAVRGAGLRLRREACGSPSSRARSGATRELADRLERGGGGAARALRRGVLDRRARRLLRARARRRQAAASTRSAPTSATCSGAASSRRTASRRSSSSCSATTLWSGWGVRTMSTRGRRVQPAQRTTTAPSGRTTTRSARRGSRATRAGRRRSRSCARCSTAAAHVRLPAAGGLRRAAARRDAVPDRVPDGRAAAGVGGRHAGAPAPGAARPAPGPAPPPLETVAPPDLPRVDGHDPPLRRARLRARVGRAAGRRRVKVSRPSEDRDPLAGVVPRAADRLRRHRVDRLAARGRARRGGPRRDAVRVGRLAHEGASSRTSSRSRRARRSAARRRRSGTRSPCFERADEFDVINDHSGPPAAVIAGAVATPCRAHGARAAAAASRATSTSRSRASSPRTGLISISMNQRKPHESCRGPRTSPTRSTSPSTRCSRTAATTCCSSAA